MDPVPPASTVRVVCRACGVPITGLLGHVADVTTLNAADQLPLVPIGAYVIASELTGIYEATWVPRDSALVNRLDVPDLREVGNREGCCGPDGMGGPNLACPLGHPVGVEIADCWTPHLVFLPGALTLLQEMPAA
jgi:hypothetical protein